MVAVGRAAVVRWRLPSLAAVVVVAPLWLLLLLLLAGRGQLKVTRCIAQRGRATTIQRIYLWGGVLGVVFCWCIAQLRTSEFVVVDQVCDDFVDGADGVHDGVDGPAEGHRPLDHPADRVLADVNLALGVLAAHTPTPHTHTHPNTHTHTHTDGWMGASPSLWRI